MTPRKKRTYGSEIYKKYIKKPTIALFQVTTNLLQDKGETKAMIKNNLDAASLLGHSLQDTSTMRRQKIKPFLDRTCASLCDLEYTDTQQLFGEDINKSLNRAKDIGSLKKYSPKPADAQKVACNHSPRQETMVEILFLCKSPNNQRGRPNKYKNH